MDSSSLFTLFIFATVISLDCLTSAGAPMCHPDDEAVLLAFKSGITRDPAGILSSWKKGTDCCDWYGVGCHIADHVTRLEISGRDNPKGRGYLRGTISPSLAKLQHLDEVSFSSLKLTGSFPQFVFRLPKLKRLIIMDTLLSGPLPANIGVLRNIEEINFDNNRFTGGIPTSTSNLTRLAWFSLRGNRLSGTIPDIFKPLKKLSEVDLSRNGFFGKLPPSFASLAPTLTYLDLSENNISGTFPSYLSKFKKLHTLDLSRNQFSGVVPKSFANISGFVKLKLSHNLLTGPFPAMKFDYSGFIVSEVDLSYNKFDLKTIPEWVTTLPYVGTLKLANCGIKMSLDDWNPLSLEYLGSIDLSENEISGSPVKLLHVGDFLASGNKLRFDLGKLNITLPLRNLDLSRNLIFGTVPASVAKLKTLNLSQNHLCGKLPVTKFPASVFTGNDCLYGSPLPPCKA